MGPGWARASGTTIPRIEGDFVPTSVLANLPVAMMLVHPTGVVAFANEAAKQLFRTDGKHLVGGNIQEFFAPLTALRPVDGTDQDVGFSTSKVQWRPNEELDAVMVWNVGRAIAFLEGVAGEQEPLRAVCWEQNLLELVGTRDEEMPAEAAEFSSIVVEEAGPSSNEVAPVPPPPSWALDEVTFEQLVDEGAEALLAKRYDAALEAYERAATLRPDATIVQGNLARLRELVRPVSS